MSDPAKWCPRCKVHKPLEAFSTSSGWCRTCARDRRRELRAAPPVGRVCGAEGCGTILSRYNRTKDARCNVHTLDGSHGLTDWAQGPGVFA